MASADIGDPLPLATPNLVSQEDHTSITSSSPDPPEVTSDTVTSAAPTSAMASPQDETTSTNSSSSHPVLNGNATPGSGDDQSSPSFDVRKDTSRYQLVYGLDDMNTSSDTSLTDSPLLSGTSRQAAPSIEEARLDAVSKPAVPDSDLSVTSDGEIRSHVSISANSNAPSSSPRLDRNAESTNQHTSENGQSTAGAQSKNSEHLVSSHNTASADEHLIGKGVSELSDSESNRLRDQQDKDTSASETGNTAVESDSKELELESKQASASDSANAAPCASDQSDRPIEVDDVSLHSRSISPEAKMHPLSVLTSDSEAEEDPVRPRRQARPLYSPIPNTSGDEDQSTQNRDESLSSNSPISPLLTSDGEEAAVMSVIFSNITYLGSSAVDAPISEVEANRKMHVLKEQSESTEPIPVMLSVPLTNHGAVVLKDPKSDQPMAKYPIRQILFCARGNAEVLLDCFCLNVRNKRSGMYQCHIFRCNHNEDCDRVFRAIGKAFTTKTIDKKTHPPLTEDTVSQDFLVSVDIQEEDSKGVFSPVNMDKDCFKLRLQTRRKLTLSVSQPSSERSLVIQRCFGMLMAPGRDVKSSEMKLLDNMNPSPNSGPSFSVSGIWEQNVSFLSSFNEETSKSVRYQYLTVAADLILDCVTQPVRFKREVKVHISRGGMSSFGGTIFNQFNQLTTSKKKTGTMDSLLHTLKLKKNEASGEYMVDELSPTGKLRSQASMEGGAMARAAEEGYRRTPSPTRLGRSGSLRGGRSEIDRGTPASGSPRNPDEESDNEEEDDTVVSGWGDVEGMNEELFKDWGEVLERWDGRERVRPTKVIKLCRKGIPRHMRCQVWQMLTGAAHDPQLSEAYRLLLTRDSPAENVINWDIKRTYVGHGYFQEEGNKAALYKISKAYSIYDEEVGYCQGFSFMAAVLLLQKMPEETAFSVLVKIMYNYGHRNLFKANFQDLHLMFFQLEKLMEENLPDLYEHMAKNRIETHMYASQWFLTLYTAKFPLSIVFRILDIYLCERTGVIFVVALALLKIAKRELLMLDFEGILNYFRVTLPKKFQTETDCQHLFQTMFSFKVSEKKLAKLERDYQSYLEQQAQLEDPVLRLERDNKQLRDTIHRLEQENDNLAEDLVSSKIKLRSEMDKLEERIDILSKECRTHKNARDEAQGVINDLREELKQAKAEFQRVMMKLTEERMQHDGAIEEYKQVFRKLDEGHQKQKEDLNRELLEVKAQLGGSEEAAGASLSSEQRLRNLELELAQTKLALVESQCKNQELEHKIVELTASKTRRWDFGKKK